MDWRVRRAEPGDGPELARVHVACWEETYGGWLPAAYLAARGRAEREAFWADLLEVGDESVHIFVACDAAGRIAGFSSGGPETTAPLGADGELYSLYVLRSAHGRGLGRRLAEEVLRSLGAENGGRVAVWVLADNPACGFYEQLGGRKIAEKREDRGGEFFTEVAYELGGGRGVER